MDGHLLVSVLPSTALIRDQRDGLFLQAYMSRGGCIAYETAQGSIAKDLFLEFLRNELMLHCHRRDPASQLPNSVLTMGNASSIHKGAEES